MQIRYNNRKNHELRKVEIQIGYNKHAEGSCRISFGDTIVLCTATIEDRVPYFLKNTGKGWITAEYGMLPRSTNSRIQREASKGRQDGRTQEIQRLIGRSLRVAVDLQILGERQILIDCDVIQADGGTRTASITGGYIALSQAVKKLMKTGSLKISPIKTQVAAISCGIIGGNHLLDLDYEEDSNAEVDANFIMDKFGNFIEIQSTSEKKSFSTEDLLKLSDLAKDGIKELLLKQQEALS